MIYCFGVQAFGALEIGVLYAFVSYIARVVEPLIQIMLQFSQLQQAVVAAARVNHLLKEPRGTVSGGDVRIQRGEVNFNHLRFGYNTQQTILHDLSLHVPAGAFYGIVGHTGSGKSTLLSLLLRFYTPQAGQISIDDIALQTISDEAFRAGVGWCRKTRFCWRPARAKTSTWVAVCRKNKSKLPPARPMCTS